MFKTKVVEKIKTYFMSSDLFLRKSCRLWDNVEKYGGAREAAGDSMIWRMRFARWITKVTNAQQWLRQLGSMLRLRSAVLIRLKMSSC